MKKYFIIIAICLNMQSFAQSSLSPKEFVAINSQNIYSEDVQFFMYAANKLKI